ncbi:MAG TPA: L-histidine N(alpha)-methyltransferase [Acidimicrobiales bacterium]|nr:L-histidine N(alpha)-methyltransferase [Acidimicrobiales bacterium]
MAASTVQVDVHLGPADLTAALLEEARVGLGSQPKALSPKWLYDERGCDLFDQITRLDEYYPFRRERSILQARAATIAEATGADTLVELGSGTSEKTRLLLDALAGAGTLERFVPFDVSEPTLREAAGAIIAEHPCIAVHAVVGDFEHHLDRLPGGGRRLIAFLGGTIGNLEPDLRAAFLREISAGMGPDDALLLGTDLVKDTSRLVRAYDDAEGVTAAFNKNVLAVLNRELGADFDLDGFDHVACYDDERDRIEMRLRARHATSVVVEALATTVTFEAGEEVRTEISAKFTRPLVEADLAAAGLGLDAWWTDDDGDFALSLSRR